MAEERKPEVRISEVRIPPHPEEGIGNQHLPELLRSCREKHRGMGLDGLRVYSFPGVLETKASESAAHKAYMN